MTEINGNKRPSFEMSLDTRAVYDRLRKVAVGEQIAFAELSTMLGRAVGGGSPTIQSALHKLESDGTIFGNVRGVGYLRLTDVDIVNTTEQARQGLRRRARKIVHRLTSVNDFDALPNELKVKHNTAVSGFGAIAAMLAPAKMTALEQSVEKAAQKLPLAKTLEAFKG